MVANAVPKAVSNMAPPASSSPEVKSSWQKFTSWIKDNKAISRGFAGLSKLQILNKYKDYLGAASSIAAKAGYGKRPKGVKMTGMGGALHNIHMRGGSWSDFTNWVKKAATKVYHKYVKPAFQKPISTIGKVASALGYDSAGNAITKIGETVGAGQTGGSRFDQINNGRVTSQR